MRAISLLDHIEAEILAQDLTNVKSFTSKNNTTTHFTFESEQLSAIKQRHHPNSKFDQNISASIQSIDPSTSPQIPKPPSLLIYSAQDMGPSMDISSFFSNSIPVPKAKIKTKVSLSPLNQQQTPKFSNRK
ncbi:hypothetical protein AVEN_115114-1 [Araneus ventricosus]|uniref:Uncharacterized protein n=1 Tax=Araneus ventricosus TaxID=182803 RepID=A0A4Y1ZYH2_ARAVE|nr:hypothetical protein AVEN_115114-1 [Araneus ventricosus]